MMIRWMPGQRSKRTKAIPLARDIRESDASEWRVKVATTTEGHMMIRGASSTWYDEPMHGGQQMEDGTACELGVPCRKLYWWLVVVYTCVFAGNSS